MTPRIVIEIGGLILLGAASVAIFVGALIVAGHFIIKYW